MKAARASGFSGPLWCAAIDECFATSSLRHIQVGKRAKAVHIRRGIFEMPTVVGRHARHPANPFDRYKAETFLAISSREIRSSRCR
jgi:hypothetical protein